LFTDYVKALNSEADDAFGDSVALIRDILAMEMIMKPAAPSGWKATSRKQASWCRLHLCIKNA
jgi:hypothetical protein